MNLSFGTLRLRHQSNPDLVAREAKKLAAEDGKCFEVQKGKDDSYYVTSTSPNPQAALKEEIFSLLSFKVHPGFIVDYLDPEGFGTDTYNIDSDRTIN